MVVRVDTAFCSSALAYRSYVAYNSRALDISRAVTRIIRYLDAFLLLLKKYESNICVVSGLQLLTKAVFSKSYRCDRRVQRDLRVRHLAHLSRAVSRYRCRSFYVRRNRRISCFASWAPRVQHRDLRSRDALFRHCRYRRR